MEGAELYQELVTEYGCPMKAMFIIISSKAKKYKPEHKIAAARIVMPYRYATKASEPAIPKDQGDLFLVWDADKSEKESNA